MNVESYVQCQVAVSLMPRLNCNVCVPLVERCGGVEGFFRESGEGLAGRGWRRRAGRRG